LVFIYSLFVSAFACQHDINYFLHIVKGRILNRFSKDMELVDQNLSPVAMFLIYSCLATVSVIFAVSIVIPQFLIAGTFIAILYILIGAYYVATSRDLKRKLNNLDLIIKY